MSSPTPQTFDFVVVGAGAAGAILASRLARSERQPSVLLVEAGGKNDSKAVRVDAERWLHRMNPAQNWHYKTIPVKGFNGSVIDYDRGKGLGGSTSINFSCWTVGPKDDHDEMARLVDDEEWSWKNAHERYKRIETYHGFPPDVPDNYKKYLDAKKEDHGYEGPIHVGVPKVWERSFYDLMDIWLANGAKFNPDHNSGDPIGMASCNSTAYQGIRSTSADALAGAPANLHVLVDTEVARVVFEGKKAIGITTLEGQTIYAGKEVILSCGSLDTPRILMHSGIGPADQLETFQIPILKANPHVGQHMKDHHHIMIDVARAEHTSDRAAFYRSKELQAAARTRWEKDGTGPLSEYATALAIGYLKLPSLADTPEFRDLSDEEKDHLQKPTIPHYEIILNGPWLPNFLDPDNATAGTPVFVFLLNMKSTGSVQLQSADPRQPLIFDANYFSHPFDKRVAIESTREVLRVLNSTEFRKDSLGIVNGPASDSEDDILDYWSKISGSTWHMMGTARMGKDESTAVVDRDFKVFGVERLRVADMSIVPIVTK